MIFHHILLDLVSDFYMAPKGSFKKTIFGLILCNTNLCRPLKTFVCVYLRYRKCCGGGGAVEIVVVVCGKICGNMCSKMCGKLLKLLDWNKNWCGSRY